MNDQAQALDQVIRLVRAAFQRLKTAGDALHKHLGVTLATRAVLESLCEGGAQTVPQIARAKSVSRQHIQGLADTAAAAGLAEFRPNPAHRRSGLLALTPQGRAVFEAMRKAEAQVIGEMARDLPLSDLAAAQRVLGALIDRLDARQDRGPAGP